MWQPGWEGNLGKNICMYMYDWVPLLSTWNYHNFVHQLYMLVTQSCPILCNPWTIANQVLLSIELSRKEYWSGLSFPSPGDLPNPGIEPRSPTLQADSLPSEPPGKLIFLIRYQLISNSVQFTSVTQSCLTLCDPMNCSTSGFPIHHQLPGPVQTHVHPVSDDIQPSHPLSSLYLPALSLSQHQGLFQWVSSSHQVAKLLKIQLQHQSFQGIFRTDLL